MPILDPRNDKDCLGKLHQAVREFMQTESCIELVRQFETEEDITEYIRALDQRDDLGDPLDGPRVQCDVSQRIRLPAKDPACYERTGMFLAFISLVDPEAEVSSATIRVDNGLHTFPMIRRGSRWVAVILDPRTSHLRNAMTATAYKLRNASPMTAANLGGWFTDTVQHACAVDGISDVFDSAIDDIRNVVLTGQTFERPADVEDMLVIGHREAQFFGPAGRVAYRRIHDSVRDLSLKAHRNGIGDVLSKILDTDKPIAGDLLKAALVAQFGPAAAIALEGVELAIKERSKDDDDDSPKKSDKAATDKVDEKPDQDQVRRNIRRMTLAPGKPKPQEN